MRMRIKTVMSAVAALLFLRFQEAAALVKATGGAEASGVAQVERGSANVTMATVGLLVGSALIWLGYRFLTRAAPKERAAGVAELAFDPADKPIRTKSVVEGVLILLAGVLVVITALWWAVG